MYLWNSPYLPEKTLSHLHSLCIDFVPLYDKTYKTYPNNSGYPVALPWH